MKNISKLVLVLFGLMTISCSDDIQDIEAVTPATGINLINPTSSFNMVLDGSKLNQVATSFVWADTNNSGDSSISYTVEAALGDTEFAAPVELGTTTDMFLNVTIGNLDTAAKAIGIQPLTEGVVDIRVKSVNGTSNVATIKVTPYQENNIHFDDDTQESEGLLLLQRSMPPGKELNVHFYVRHSRSDVRNAANALLDIAKELGIDALGPTENILGTNITWLEITKKALPHIGKALARIPDRDMGFISMFERFGDEFLADGEIDRKKTGGFCTIVYSWAIDMK